jgi:hypothetical protein
VKEIVSQRHSAYEEESYAAWDYGHVALLEHIAQKTGLKAELQKAFPAQ